jgi:hypothetical protein
VLGHQRRVATIAAIVGAMALCAGWATGHGLTPGQLGADTSCTTPGDFVAAQTATSGGVSYTVPPGRWAITSWSAAGGAKTGSEALVVFRPTHTPDEYDVVGSTSAHKLSNSKNTFGAAIKVKGGDLIGFWAEAGSICALRTSDPGDTASIFFPSGVPTRGTTMTLYPGYAVGYRLNMKVTLTPRAVAP